MAGAAEPTVEEQEAVGEQAAVAAQSAAAAQSAVEPSSPTAAAAGEARPDAGVPRADGFEQAAAGLIETGVRFLESVAEVMRSAPAGEGPNGGIDRKLASLVSRDPKTGRPHLSIPLPPTVDESRIARAIAGLLSAFQR